MNTAVPHLEAVIPRLEGWQQGPCRSHTMALLTHVSGSLLPSYRDGAMELKGTIPTTHQFKQYHTPILIRMADYPRSAPAVAVVPTESMRPYTRAQGYEMRPDGVVIVPYSRNWRPGYDLYTLVCELQRAFDTEPPLYTSSSSNATATPARRFTVDQNEERRVAAFFNEEVIAKGSAYQNLPRAIRDVTEALEEYRSLQLKVEGADREVVLVGTVPCLYNSVQYNYPVAITVVRGYPIPHHGIPKARVVPTEGMQIKPGHRHVDQMGNVFTDYFSRWREDSSLKLAIVKMIDIFSREPPVYSLSSRQQNAQYQPVQQQQYQAQQPTPQPPAQQAAAVHPSMSGRQSLSKSVKSEILKKVGENPRVTPTDAEDRSCIICWTNEKDCLILPCRHLAICGECTVALIKDSKDNEAPQCPMCRGDIADVIQVFK